MLFRFTFKTILVIGLCLGGISVYGVDEPMNENDPENPFGGSGKVEGTDGGGDETICNVSEFPIFTITMNSGTGLDISLGSFPCDLYVGITPEGENSPVEYLPIRPSDFSPYNPTGTIVVDGPGGSSSISMGLNTGTYIATVKSETIVLDVLQNCPDGYRKYNYTIELFCYDAADDSYAPIQYCGADSPWEDYFGAILTPADDCQDDDAGRIRGDVVYVLCCGTTRNDQGENGRDRDAPLSSNQNPEFKALPSFEATEITLTSNHTEYEIIITDLAGRVRSRTELLRTKRSVISHEHLEAGIYFCSVVSNGQIETKKIIVY